MNDEYRVFVELKFPGTGSGGYLNTLNPDFNEDLTDMIERGAIVTKCEVRGPEDWVDSDGLPIRR